MNATAFNSTYTALANATGPAVDAARGAGSLARPENLVSWGGYFQALAVLCLIIAALWAALWYFKRRGGLTLLGLTENLTLEGRLSLGPKKNLMVVRFLNKRLLLGVTDQQITLLTELPIHDDTARQSGIPSSTASFTDVLNAARTERPAGES